MKRIHIFKGQEYVDWLAEQNLCEVFGGPNRKSDTVVVVKRFGKIKRQIISEKIMKHCSVNFKQIILEFKHELWIDTHYGEFFGGSDI